MKRLYGLCTYQLNSFQYVKVNGEDTKKDHQGQMLRRDCGCLTMDVCGSVNMVREELHILHVSRKGQIRQVLPSVHAEGV